MTVFLDLLKAGIAGLAAASGTTVSGLAIGDMFTVILALQTVQLTVTLTHRGRIASNETAIDNLEDT